MGPGTAWRADLAGFLPCRRSYQRSRGHVPGRRPAGEGKTGTVDKARALAVFEAQVSRILSILESKGTDLHAPVPSCPGWTVEDVAVHLGRVYSLVAAAVGGDPAAPPDRGRLPTRDAGEAAVSWMRRRFRVLWELLSQVPDDGLAWNFVEGVGAPVSFWWRRQVHETTVHRVDVELAVGLDVTRAEPEIAADGIDEFLLISGHRQIAWDSLVLGEAMTIHLHATDVPDAEWTVDSGTRCYARAHLKGDVALRGPAWELAMWCWGRAGESASQSGELELHGDAAAAEAWRPRL